VLGHGGAIKRKNGLVPQGKTHEDKIFNHNGFAARNNWAYGCRLRPAHPLSRTHESATILQRVLVGFGSRLLPGLPHRLVGPVVVTVEAQIFPTILA
jgi:hypothetical protein